MVGPCSHTSTTRNAFQGHGSFSWTTQWSKSCHIFWVQTYITCIAVFAWCTYAFFVWRAIGKTKTDMCLLSWSLLLTVGFLSTFIWTFYLLGIHIVILTNYLAESLFGSKVFCFVDTLNTRKCQRRIWVTWRIAERVRDSHRRWDSSVKQRW